jgi:hypothetical protein
MNILYMGMTLLKYIFRLTTNKIVAAIINGTTDIIDEMCLKWVLVGIRKRGMVSEIRTETCLLVKQP